MINMELMCTTCGASSNDIAFEKDVSRVSGFKNRCKGCSVKKTQKYLKELTPEDKTELGRRTQYQYKYGITIEWYDTKLKEQDNRCAICDIHISELDKRFAVDHDHDTGNVRGLLCSNCNTGIGLLKDSKKVLAKAYNYLDKYK